MMINGRYIHRVMVMFMFAFLLLWLGRAVI